MLAIIKRSLDDDKALDPAVIDLEGKTSIADFMVVATGTSQRHIASMAEKVMERLKAAGHTHVAAEGLQDPAGSWVLIWCTCSGPRPAPSTTSRSSGRWRRRAGLPPRADVPWSW